MVLIDLIHMIHNSIIKFIIFGLIAIGFLDLS